MKHHALINHVVKDALKDGPDHNDLDLIADIKIRAFEKLKLIYMNPPTITVDLEKQGKNMIRRITVNLAFTDFHSSVTIAVIYRRPAKEVQASKKRLYVNRPYVTNLARKLYTSHGRPGGVKALEYIYEVKRRFYKYFKKHFGESLKVGIDFVEGTDADLDITLTRDGLKEHFIIRQDARGYVQVKRQTRYENTKKLIGDLKRL